MAETKKTEAAAAAAPPEAACLTLRQKLVEMRKACPEIVKKQHSDGVSIVPPQLGIGQLLQSAFLGRFFQRLLQLSVLLFQPFVLHGSFRKCHLILLHGAVHLLHRRDILIQQSRNLGSSAFCVKGSNTGQQFFQLGFLLGQSGHLFEHSGWDVVTSGLAGTFPTLQVGIFPHHVFPELVLPLGQLFLISHNLLGAEPAIRSHRDKRKVHMGRFLVHMHHS